DVANTIEELGSIDLVQAFRDFYPCRSLTPREYANNHLLKRKVKFVYAGLGEEIPTQCPRGWDLLVVCGVAFTRRDTEDLVEQMEKICSNKRVLLGVPLSSLNVIQQLRELCALRVLEKMERYDKQSASGAGLQSRKAFVRRQLVERARKALAPSAFRWMCEGKVVEEAPAGSRGFFVSGFLQTVYSASPRITLGCSKRDCIEALDELLDLAHPLQISNVSKRGAVKVLRRFMIETGIFVHAEDQGGYSRYEVAEYLQNSDWSPIWRHFIEKLTGDGSGVRYTDLDAFSRELMDAPWGISRPVQGLLLAAMLRRAYPDLNFEYEGEPMTLSGQALLRALGSPKGWKLCYRPASAHEMNFLAKVRGLFAVDQSIADGVFVNIWDRSLRAITSWYQKLSGVAKLKRETMSIDTQQFVELITDVKKRENPSDLLGMYLPQLCGESGIPLEEDQDIMLDWLEECKLELESREATFQRSLCTELGKILGAELPYEGASAQWLDEQYRNWLSRLPAGWEAGANSEMASTFCSILNLDIAADERWFVVIPQRLGLSAINVWTRDMTPMYRARVAKICVELQTCVLRRAMPWPKDEAELKKALTAWLTGTFAGMGLDSEQRESVLLDMMEGL
ncbi:hypothetical protein IJT17_07585, partial [bacterium]|nr:hypothetical protein [bacterium]